MTSSASAAQVLSGYFDEEEDEQRSHHASMKTWLPKRQADERKITVHASGEWNKSYAVILGALAGAAYAFLMCGLANLLSISMASTVVLALAAGAAIGAATLGGIASLLNYVKTVDLNRDERLATEILPLHPSASSQSVED